MVEDTVRIHKKLSRLHNNESNLFGLYTVINDNSRNFQVFRDSDSEHEFALNLIPSCSLSQNLSG